MSIALDLPKSHQLRKTMDAYKKRFEEYSDERPGFQLNFLPTGTQYRTF